MEKLSTYKNVLEQIVKATKRTDIELCVFHSPTHRDKFAIRLGHSGSWVKSSNILELADLITARETDLTKRYQAASRDINDAKDTLAAIEAITNWKSLTPSDTPPSI